MCSVIILFQIRCIGVSLFLEAVFCPRFHGLEYDLNLSLHLFNILSFTVAIHVTQFSEPYSF